MTEKYELDEMVEFIFYEGNKILGRLYHSCCAQCARVEGNRRFPEAKMATVVVLDAPPMDEFDIPGRCIRESNRLRWEAATGQTE